MTMRLLVTGANGFLGQVILRDAIHANLSVVATDRHAQSTTENVIYHGADILQPSSFSSIIKEFDVIIHVAGLVHLLDRSKISPTLLMKVNAEGTKNIAHMAAKRDVRHFILISSVSVYGGVSLNNDENALCRPENPYAESKLQAENHAIQIAHESGMNLTILRLTTLYGEGDPGNVARVIRAVDQSRFIWIGKGENFKSLLHREDAARACMAAIQAPASGINIYNVSAPPCKMHDIVSAITCALGKSVPSWHIPESFALNSAKIIKKLSLNRGLFSTLHNTLQKWLADDYYNTDKFFKDFNFQTKVSLEEGMQREVVWYKAKLLE
jgi:nucleoside-diphosphate-sugar epimerase